MAESSADIVIVGGGIAGMTGLDHVYVATGGARKGILDGPAVGQAIADLVLGAARGSRSTPSRPAASPPRRPALPGAQGSAKLSRERWQRRRELGSRVRSSGRSMSRPEPRQAHAAPCPPPLVVDESV